MRNEAMPMINNFKVNGVDFVEITNNVGMVVTFANLGASIYSIKYMGDLMTYQAESYEDFFKPTIYNGKTIGRVAGRIKGNEIKIGNKKYKLEPNEGENVLHGGANGLSTKMFSQRVFNTTEHVHVVYTYFCKHEESRFPGNALFEVHYIVSNNKPKLKVKLLSYVTEKGPISFTNHTYLSLGDSNLKNMKMRINASKCLDMDAKDLIFKEEKKCPKYLNFKEAKPVLEDIDAKELNKGKLNGYDHCFIFDEVDDRIPQITLENNKYSVNIFTDFDSAVVYSDNFDLGFKADNSKDKTRRGIAVEPQKNPLGDRFLSRGDEFDYFVRYEFIKK